jgi:hypothetical protein
LVAHARPSAADRGDNLPVLTSSVRIGSLPSDLSMKR